MSESIVQKLVSARQEGRCLETYPGEAPADASSAYAMQKAGRELLNKPVGGWKVVSIIKV